MDHFIAAPQDGHVRQVDFVELGQLTQTGWVLVGVVDHQEVVDVEEPIPFPEVQAEHIKKFDSYRYNGGGGFDGGRVATWKKKVLVTSKRYIVRQSADATHEELVQKLSSTESRANNAEWKLDQISQQLESSKAEVAKLGDKQNEVGAALSTARRALGDSEESRRRLEQDLAKIRVAIGESRFKKILAGKDDGQ